MCQQSWRPLGRIRVKAIAIAIQKNSLLVCEVLDDQLNLKGWSPLGGGVEFGEKAEEGLKREIFEELQCEIHIIDRPLVFENIFDHHGVTGHEIIFAFPITFKDEKIYSQIRFQIQEHRGTKHWAEWVEIDHFFNKKAILFPNELVMHLKNLIKN